MRRIVVEGAAEASTYVLGHGALGEVRTLACGNRGDARCFVVTDEHVGPLWADALADDLGAPSLTLPAGEERKRWPAVETTVHWLLRHGLERRDVVVAMGGGVITDLVGFAAAVTLRGVRWMAVPTTLLAMVDAAIGGKTGIDLEEGKNLVGSFWPPCGIAADLRVLTTLDLRQLRSGLAEVVKAGMIAPASLEHQLDTGLGRLSRGDATDCEDLLAACVKVKSEIVGEDMRERGLRASLNLGHTLGHALEAATGYRRFLHGEAVVWGLMAELIVSRGRGLMSTEEARRWAERLELLRPLPAVEDLSWEVLAPFVARDKKRRAGRVGWVLPRRGGVVVDVDVEDGEARAAFERLREILHLPLASAL